MEAISDDLKPRVQVRATKWFMTWSGVAVDPESDDGVIQLEFYHYGNPAGNHLDDRLNLVLTKQSPFYEGFWNSLSKMWSHAKVLKA